MSAYGETALDRECAELERLSDGRHQRLCHATFVLGQLVGAGELDRGEGERALYAAAFACGYVKKRGDKATKATIQTGLDRGKSKPRLIKRAARQTPSAPPRPPADDDWAAPEFGPVSEPACGPHNTADLADKAERAKAQWLWRQRQPIAGTIAEVYLRQARGYGGVIQPALGFLPARGDHAPALIVAFGIATEPEPSVLAIDDGAVMAVQLTKLMPDGTGKADVEPAKITIGRNALGSPIVLAPPNDLLGLVIAEGVENALTVHEAAGLGAWASGGATRMPALADAVPSYIDCITVIVDDDDAGRRHAGELVARLKKRGFEAIAEEAWS